MTDDLFSVRDQRVVVSGGSRGIGRAIAAGFAARGAMVVISGREEQTLSRAAAEICPPGGTVLPRVCDVGCSDSIRAFVERVLGECGHVDTLINVAGVNRRKPAETVTEEDYDFILDV